MTTLDRINTLSNTRFELYRLLSRRIAEAPPGQGVGPAPATLRLIRLCDGQLKELWKQRRHERRGEALRIVEAWWGLSRGRIAPVVR